MIFLPILYVNSYLSENIRNPPVRKIWDYLTPPPSVADIICERPLNGLDRISQGSNSLENLSDWRTKGLAGNWKRQNIAVSKSGKGTSRILEQAVNCCESDLQRNYHNIETGKILLRLAKGLASNWNWQNIDLSHTGKETRRILKNAVECCESDLQRD